MPPGFDPDVLALMRVWPLRALFFVGLGGGGEGPVVVAFPPGFRGDGRDHGLHLVQVWPGRLGALTIKARGLSRGWNIGFKIF